MVCVVVFSCLSICLLLLDNISLSSDKPFIMQVTPLEENKSQALVKLGVFHH